MIQLSDTIYCMKMNEAEKWYKRFDNQMPINY